MSDESFSIIIFCATRVALLIFECIFFISASLRNVKLLTFYIVYYLHIRYGGMKNSGGKHVEWKGFES